VYTSHELRDRFQTKSFEDKDEKVNVPNLNKRRNSAPPGMIHFPPGTFSSAPNGNSSKDNHNHHHNNNNNNHDNNNNGFTSLTPVSISPASSPSSSPRPSFTPSTPTYPQHSLVTHAKGPSKTSFSSPYPPTKLDRRRSSLPHILHPPAGYANPAHQEVPTIEHYFQHIQDLPAPIDFNNADRATRSSFNAEVKQFLCTTAVERQILPSFQALLQTIHEEGELNDDDDEESEELKIINGDVYHTIDDGGIDSAHENESESASSTGTRQSMEISQLLS